MKRAIWLWRSLSELTTLWARAVSAHRASDLLGVTSPTNQRGRLKALSHWKLLLTGAASVITHQLSLKGSSRRCSSCNKSQSTTLKLQKHLNIIYLWFPRWGKRGRNRGIQSYKWNLLYNAESRNLSKFGWINQKWVSTHKSTHAMD